MSEAIDRLVALATKQYLESGDFNGLPSHALGPMLGLPQPDALGAAETAIGSGRVSALFGDIHPNPHIRAFTDEPAESQLAKLRSGKFDGFVLYPTRATLATTVDPHAYAGRPYSLRLAQGQGQLEYASFELSVLDFYRRDPRFRFWSNDVAGTISIGDEAYESNDFPAKHKISIQSFGFSYSDDMERAVAVFLTDLSGLTPEHQQLWATHERIDKGFRLLSCPGFRRHPLKVFFTESEGQYGRSTEAQQGVQA